MKEREKSKERKGRREGILEREKREWPRGLERAWGVERELERREKK